MDVSQDRTFSAYVTLGSLADDMLKYPLKCVPAPFSSMHQCIFYQSMMIESLLNFNILLAFVVPEQTYAEKGISDVLLIIIITRMLKFSIAFQILL